MRAGIEKYFHITVTPEIRAVEVYALTAIPGKTPPAKPESETFGGASFSMSRTIRVPEEFRIPEDQPRTRKAVEDMHRRMTESPEFLRVMALSQLTGMTAFSNSIEELCGALEEGLRRPIADETGLTGTYDFHVQGDPQSTEEFLTMLRDQVGLVLTPTRKTLKLRLSAQSNNRETRIADIWPSHARACRRSFTGLNACYRTYTLSVTFRAFAIVRSTY